MIWQKDCLIRMFLFYTTPNDAVSDDVILTSLVFCFD